MKAKTSPKQTTSLNPTGPTPKKTPVEKASSVKKTYSQGEQSGVGPTTKKKAS